MIKNSRRSKTLIAVFLMTSFIATLFLSGISVKASILGPKYYYLYLEKENLEDISKKCKDYYKDKKLIESSYECKASAKLDGDFMKNDEEIKQVADYLSKLEFNAKYNLNNKNIDNNYYTLYLGAKYDNKDFADMDIKSADKKTILTFPSLVDKALGIEQTDIYDASANLIKLYTGDDKAFEKLFGQSRDVYKDLLAEYIKETVIDQIPDSKVELNKNAIFNDIKCNSIRFIIDKEVVSNIYKALADKLEKDQDLRDICYTTTNSFISNFEVLSKGVEKPTKEGIDEEIKNICEGLNGEVNELEDISVTYTAYYKNNGDIISRQIEDECSNLSLGLSTYKDSLGNDILNIISKEEENKIFELNNQKKLLKGNYDGQCTIKIFDEDLMKVNYTYEKDAKVGNMDAFVGNIEGKIDLDKLKSNLKDSTIEATTNNLYFSINNKKKDNNTMQGKSAFTCKVDGKRIGLTVFTDIKQLDKCNIAKPNISLDNAIMIDDANRMGEFNDEISERMQEKIMGLLLYNEVAN